MAYVPPAVREPRASRHVSRRSICRHCELVVEFVHDQFAPEGVWRHQATAAELCFPDEQLVAEPDESRRRA